MRILIGYGTNEKAYKHWDSSSERAIVSRDVSFQESENFYITVDDTKNDTVTSTWVPCTETNSDKIETSATGSFTITDNWATQFDHNSPVAQGTNLKITTTFEPFTTAFGSTKLDLQPQPFFFEISVLKSERSRRAPLEM